MKHDGMKWSGVEWNKDFIPMFGYFMKGIIMLSFHCLESGRNETNYNIFIPFCPYSKTLLLSKTYFYYNFFRNKTYTYWIFFFESRREQIDEINFRYPKKGCDIIY